MKYLLIILICLVSFFSKAQTTFERVYSDSGITSAYDITTTFDGGYAVTGFKTCGSFGCLDFFLLKLDSLGNQEWVRLYDAFGTDDHAYSVKQTSDSGFVLTGLVSTPPNLMNNVRLMKTDKNGNKLWDRNYGGLGCQRGNDVQITNDGGFIIATQQDTGGNCFEIQIELIKTDANGIIEWQKTYFNAGGGRSVAVKQTLDSGFVCTGVTNNMLSATSSEDIFLVKADKNGNEEWVKFYGNIGYERGEDVIVTSDGGFVICGHTQGFFNSNQIATYVVKTDSMGDTLWTKVFEKGNQNVVWSVIEDNSNNYVMAGSSFNGVPETDEAYLLKISNIGDKILEKNFNQSNGINGLQSIVLAQDGGYVMCGMSSSRVYVIKTDTNGLVVGINDIIPSNTVPVNVYPNPTSGEFTINLKNASTNGVGFTLTTLEGKVIQQEQKVSSTIIVMDLSEQPKGIYLLKIEDAQSVKMYKVIRQ